MGLTDGDSALIQLSRLGREHDQASFGPLLRSSTEVCLVSLPSKLLRQPRMKAEEYRTKVHTPVTNEGVQSGTLYDNIFTTNDVINYHKEGFNGWGGRLYGDFVPGEVTKTAPSGDETT